MRRAGCATDECLALEDASRGVISAVAAGVPCVAVLNDMTRYEPPTGALLTLNSLAELDLDSLAANWR
jgi:beta-phosphoglucomutase-like phosphatase (HAD superfamily)